MQDYTLVGNTLNALRILLWKFIVIQFTGVDLEGTRFDCEVIWRMAIRRLLTLLNRIEWGAHINQMTAPNQKSAESGLARACAKLAPLAALSETGIHWLPPLAEAAAEAGVSLQPSLPPPKRVSPTVGAIAFLKETVDATHDFGLPDLVATRNGLCLKTLRTVSVQAQGETIKVYIRNSASARDRPILFTEGSFLPLVEAAPLTDLTHALLRAAQVRSPDNIVIYSRPQLCLFAPGAEVDGARDHIQDLQDAGLNDPIQVTVIHCSESEHNIRQECTTLCNHLQEKDVWQLHGPRVTIATMAPPPPRSDSDSGFDIEGNLSSTDPLSVDWELQADDGDLP